MSFRNYHLLPENYLHTGNYTGKLFQWQPFSEFCSLASQTSSKVSKDLVFVFWVTSSKSKLSLSIVSSKYEIRLKSNERNDRNFSSAAVSQLDEGATGNAKLWPGLFGNPASVMSKPKVNNLIYSWVQVQGTPVQGTFGRKKI